ncbi:hypothetical protein CYLTODRAFT_425102 [Cylindrobasidium torrendii FP15055 ss-10]|uniref:RING-type domain-containing protein n=1 Tax=Cylindrobasidium torrendii FP15055 ss-10 TaxID=1314674 RepID=A0A0D7B2W7_9AGAR|nr:hypothetical protein CYLTODRAFT_425102 [Cylindrobasidium torrendii FP15055 ss-10]
MSTVAADKDKDKKHPDSLFGPNIGVVTSGPEWTNEYQKKVLTDELTHDIVKGWIEKSKDPQEPTTTLQALVNLKRPTLRLLPLTTETAEGGNSHGLEFEFDCDAPKCGIYVHVFLPADHPDAPAASSASGLAKLLVFESVVDGGFAKVFKLAEGATLELDRFEHDHTQPSSSTSPDPSAATTPAGEVSPDVSTPPTEGSRARRRFTAFQLRKRSQNHDVSGPALAVLDAEPVNQDNKDGKKEDEGVRVTIRLAALDEQGAELTSPNEQITYLNVVRFGPKPSTPATGEHAEDTRPWVVKVVKREATIGPHTFHLHEIYGLSSSSSGSHAPTAPLPDTNTYPPESPPQHAPVADEEPSSECLLCLSSAREVVLLPCRHLVACKDCALNMVEFGAGGSITHPEETTAGDDTAANGDEGAEATNNQAVVPTPAPAPTRRKRKAKGWFCPVCRQPYTSLLRISSSPPEDELPGVKTEATPAPAPAQMERSTTSGSILSSIRPSFLRGFSRNQPNDVEAQRSVPAAA